MRTIISVILFSMLIGLPVSAQFVSYEDSAALMRQLQNAEEHLLRMRDAYMNQESAVDDPIWVKGEDGISHVIDGADLRQRAQGFAFVAQALELEQLMLDQLPTELQIIAGLMGEEGRSDIAVERLMEGYRRLSLNNRREAFAAIDTQLERVRDAFLEAMRVRDQGDAANSAGDQNSAGSGITINQSKLALSGVKVCSSPSLTSGREWRLRNPAVPGASTYHERSRFLCRADGIRFFEVNGRSLTAFTCGSKLVDCAHDANFDAVYGPPSRTSNLGGVPYTIWTLDWTNSTSANWDLWIQD